MDIKAYFLPLRRWWWLIVISTLVAAGFSYIALRDQPPVYQARTTLMIGRTIEDPNPTNNQFFLSQQLASIYADIALRDVVRNATMEALGLNWLPEYRAGALPNSQLIEIVVSDVNPQRAQVVANELAFQLIQQSPGGTEQGERDRQEFILRQLDTLEVQIEETQSDIAELQDELGSMVSARQINDTQNQIAALQAKLNTLQANYANLLSNTQRGAINTLSIIEPAGLPRNPVGPNKGLSIMLAAAVGMALAVGASYLMEFLDDTVKNQEEIKRKIDAPLLGFIPEVSYAGNGELFVPQHPRHPFTEAFRSLRTNIEFVGVDEPLRTLFIASSDPGEGKTSVAVNLAAIMAQGGKKVVIIDADFRRPNVHNSLNVTNGAGLSDVFLNQSKLSDVIRVHAEGGFYYITAGKEPPNPAELLGSNRMTQILEKLCEIFDMLILDGPPFIVADAPVLAAKADGVLVVARPGFTKENSLQALKEELQLANAKIVGIVLNRVNPRQHYNYRKGYIDSGYYSEDAEGLPPGSPKKVLEKGMFSVKGAALLTGERAQKLRIAAKERMQKGPLSKEEPNPKQED